MLQQGEVIYSLAADNHYTFAATGAGILRLENSGNRPEYIKPYGLAGAVTAVAVSPPTAQRQQVLAAFDGMTTLSRNSGRNWSLAPLASPPPIVTALQISDSGMMFAATLDDGVFVSEDGDQWQAWNFGLLDRHVFALVPAEDQLVFIGTSTGIFCSMNMGRSWYEAGDATIRAPVNSLAISPNFAHDGIALAGTDLTGLWQSRDIGATWVRKDSDRLSGSIDAIILAPNYPVDPKLLILHQGILLYSDDDGVSWTRWHRAENIVQPITAVVAPQGLYTPSSVVVGLGDGTILTI